MIAFVGFAEHAAVVAISCLSFGAPETAVALWLWRTDPNRWSGALAACCHLVLAALKVSLGALAIIMGIGFGWVRLTPTLTGVVGPQSSLAATTFRGASLALAGGVVVAGALAAATLAVGTARPRPLWLGRITRSAWEQGAWPPWAALGDDESPNRVKWVLSIPLCIGLVSLYGCALVWYTMRCREWLFWPFFLCATAALVAAVIGTLMLVERRLQAQSAYDVWCLEPP